MTKRGLNDKWIRIIGIPLIGLLLIIISDNSWDALPISLKLLKLCRNVFYVFFYWESNRIVFLYLRKEFPHPKDFLKKIVIQAVIFVFFIGIFGLVITGISQTMDNPDQTFLEDFKDTIAKSTILLLLVSVCYECAFFFRNWEYSLYESERLKKESIISQFELLKNQISPHFLFNSLNALITLVPEDPQLSVLYIQKLSNVYRHVLAYNEKNVIELKTEFEFLNDYIFLFKIRFGENLIINYHLPNLSVNVTIIPFTLQMLVENAIKHNIISTRKPLTITITAVGDKITVRNNLQKKTSGVESTHTGLNNIINRYKLLTNQMVEIDESTTDFSVSLPLLSKTMFHEGINY